MDNVKMLSSFLPSMCKQTKSRTHAIRQLVTALWILKAFIAVQLLTMTSKSPSIPAEISGQGHWSARNRGLLDEDQQPHRNVRAFPNTNWLLSATLINWIELIYTYILIFRLFSNFQTWSVLTHDCSTLVIVILYLFWVVISFLLFYFSWVIYNILWLLVSLRF